MSELRPIKTVNYTIAPPSSGSTKMSETFDIINSHSIDLNQNVVHYSDTNIYYNEVNAVDASDYIHEINFTSDLPAVDHNYIVEIDVQIMYGTPIGPDGANSRIVHKYTQLIKNDSIYHTINGVAPNQTAGKISIAPYLNQPLVDRSIINLQVYDKTKWFKNSYDTKFIYKNIVLKGGDNLKFNFKVGDFDTIEFYAVSTYIKVIKTGL